MWLCEKTGSSVEMFKKGKKRKKEIEENYNDNYTHNEKENK